MDDSLVAILKQTSGKGQVQLNPTEQTVAVVDGSGKPGEPQKVKSLDQLYGKGTGAESANFTDEKFYPVLMAIEESLLDAYTDQPELTDAAALLALDRLCQSPEANVHSDQLAGDIQFALRVALSFNEFSRQDVRQCLRKVKQSVARHNKLSGTRGYLNFIRTMLPGK